MVSDSKFALVVILLRSFGDVLFPESRSCLWGQLDLWSAISSSFTAFVPDLKTLIQGVAKILYSQGNTCLMRSSRSWPLTPKIQQFHQWGLGQDQFDHFVPYTVWRRTMTALFMRMTRMQMIDTLLCCFWFFTADDKYTIWRTHEIFSYFFFMKQAYSTCLTGHNTD